MARSGVVNVYIKDVSPRAAWVFKLIFEDLLGLQMVLTNNTSLVASENNPALNYSSEQIQGVPAIIPAGLLSEKGIREQEINMLDFEGLPVFFRSEGGDLPFDPFSTAFYLVSRYEEYLPFEPDKHGRFPFAASLAHKEGFLNIALVNRLAMLLKDLLLKYYPEMEIDTGKYRFIPTIDIDIAFAHLGKGFVRTWGAMIKLMMRGRITEIRNRIKSMQGKAQDPYDNFDFINEVCEENSLHPLYFVLAGDPGKYDRNLSLENNKFATLIRELDKKGTVGVHPSYRSGDDPHRISKEIERLKTVTGRDISKSRQHFVRLEFPATYSILIDNGILEDYSMGYADTSGFRASIATPFTFFNLNEEKETLLKVYPFMFMDSTLSDYMFLAPDQYVEAVKPVIEEVKACKGILTGIWHNYALSDDVKKHMAFRELIKLSATT